MIDMLTEIMVKSYLATLEKQMEHLKGRLKKGEIEAEKLKNALSEYEQLKTEMTLVMWILEDSRWRLT